MTIDELLDATCNEMVTYELFWGKAASYLLLGIEEMALLETIAYGRDIFLGAFMGLRVIPIHDSYHHIGVA